MMFFKKANRSIALILHQIKKNVNDYHFWCFKIKKKIMFTKGEHDFMCVENAVTKNSDDILSILAVSFFYDIIKHKTDY